MFTRKRQLIKQLLIDTSYISKNVTVFGWIESFRVQKGGGIAFITLNDGSGLSSIQIIIDPKTEEEKEKLDTIYQDGTKGVSLEVYGKIVKSPAKGQLIELKAERIKILGKVNASEYPISKSKLPLEHLRKEEHIHLRIRTKTIASIARLRNICATATHDFFQQHSFQYVHTPIITGNDCEGAGETFSISNTLGEEPFFGKPVGLSVSGQLHGEAYAAGLGDIYTFGPTFRAENSNTQRHLGEFWMIEPEMCFIDLKDLMDITEDYIRFCIKSCLEKCKDEIEFMNGKYQTELLAQLKSICENPFHRMNYTELIECLEKEIEEGKVIVRIKDMEHKKFKKLSKGKHIFEEPVFWGCDLGSEHEKYMTDTIIKGPLIVYDYPEEIKSFYMKKNKESTHRTVQAMDVLVPKIGELVGGSMRIDNYEEIKEKMESLGIDIPWYLDLRKYGSVPHGGFGLGFERLVMLVSGIYNIKDIMPFPRYPKHCPM
jgi:asparaginyl-tRNA synthetase